MTNRLGIWKKVWSLLDARERRNALIVLALSLAAALSSAVMVGSVMPFLTVLAQPSRIETIPALSWAYHRFGFSSDYAFLVALGIASLAVIVLTSLLQILRTYVASRYTLMRMHTISHRLLAAYLRQPYEFFLDHHTGEMSTQILSESQTVVEKFFQPAAQIIVSGATVLAIVGLLLWVDPLVAVLAFGILGGAYGGTLALTRRHVGKLGAIRAEANRARYRLAGEALGGIKDIKLIGREATYLDRYAAPSLRMARSLIGVSVIASVPHYAMQSIAFGGIILLCLTLLSPEGLASGEALSAILPMLGLFAFAGQRLMPELTSLFRSLTELRFAGAAVDAVHRDLTERETAALPSRQLPVALGLKCSLDLEGVTYRYPRDSRAGLTDITLSIRAGERIGIVGSTGAGKTTFVDLILGLLRPCQGIVRVDGASLTNENLRAWQQGIAYVPQEIFLIDASIAENIALGVPPNEIDMARVEFAARIAQLEGFIRTELPEGYRTSVGERGVRLSGGQRQRIGIARALYRDAQVIVFDEATSALDNLTEREVIVL